MSIAIRPLETIRELLSSMPETESEGVVFQPGQVLLREGELNRKVSLIIKGEIQLAKTAQDGSELALGMLRSGQFLGLLSLSSGEPSFFTARARTPGTMLTMASARFGQLLHERHDFNRLVAPLLLGNLVERYRAVVRLHLEVAQLTRELNVDKLQLEQTIDELRASRNRLIQQEKMATLGQLVAGIAHEINNPMSSLSRATETLADHLTRVLAEPIDADTVSLLQRSFQAGLLRQSLATEEQRQRNEALAIQFSQLPRRVVRVLATLEPGILEGLRQDVAGQPAVRQPSLWQRVADFYEGGGLIRSIRLASQRISNIVRSLKSYSRHDRAEEAEVDLREGLRDTLVLFGYVLKKFNLSVDLPDIPPVRCRPSEINQVWTNLILNACEAMGESGGTLMVSCGMLPPHHVWVRIQDTGPGIPPDIRERIFESSFSTKTAMASDGPGLGLGLSIARSLVEKHQGRIEVDNAPGGGACFTVVLPV
ncbi:MAG TPA: ATP-binding protein [Candidatus Paceibacterota bacterium]|nr:ATP-binding protein [Verrucomicrobiota bacterium]HRY51254.1 ATP-binding protein [Candidatus Paceibacterota bacterium]